MDHKKITTGVIAELNGKYWGVQHSDGHYTFYDFSTLEKATIADEKYCKNPTNMTSSQWGRDKNAYNNLSKATLKKVTIITTYKLG